RFEIDMLRCIYCGMCEEACPCDAIALSTVHCISSVTREEKIYDRNRLLFGGDALGEQASSRCPTEGAWRGAWERERTLPPIPDAERAIIEGRI
ncbi:MAG TPA: 4Fe-4S binding protein, partial [Planctomycetota bacterium]|nr:4Fe-4S binding protein [Planctomycetota bacterium]